MTSADFLLHCFCRMFPSAHIHSSPAASAQSAKNNSIELFHICLFFFLFKVVSVVYTGYQIPISQSGDLFFFLLLESQMIMLLNAVFPCPENHQIQQYQEGQYAQQQHHSYFWFFLKPIFFSHRH